MLSVLPKEMQAIPDHEAVLLSESEEKKRLSNPRQSAVIQEKQGLDIHVPVSQEFHFKNLQGLVNIHLHFQSK